MLIGNKSERNGHFHWTTNCWPFVSCWCISDQYVLPPPSGYCSVLLPVASLAPVFWGCTTAAPDKDTGSQNQNDEFWQSRRGWMASYDSFIVKQTHMLQTNQPKPPIPPQPKQTSRETPNKQTYFIKAFLIYLSLHMQVGSSASVDSCLNLSTYLTWMCLGTMRREVKTPLEYLYCC